MVGVKTMVGVKRHRYCMVYFYLFAKYEDILNQLCPTEMPYWVKNNVDIFMRAANCITYCTFILAYQRLV